VGALTETVIVQATATQLQTESADRGGVLAGQQLTDIAVQGRNFMNLMALVPGVVNANPYNANVNGGRTDQMSFKIDGITNMDSGINGCCAVWINMDTVAEFKMLTNSQTADIGRSAGAAVSAVTRSGGRDFHGDAYWFHRNEEFNADSWQNNQASPYVPRPPYRYNILGSRLYPQEVQPEPQQAVLFRQRGVAETVESGDCTTPGDGSHGGRADRRFLSDPRIQWRRRGHP
jgi:hypothetical protein